MKGVYLSVMLKMSRMPHMLHMYVSDIKYLEKKAFIGVLLLCEHAKRHSLMCDVCL